MKPDLKWRNCLRRPGGLAVPASLSAPVISRAPEMGDGGMIYLRKTIGNSNKNTMTRRELIILIALGLLGIAVINLLNFFDIKGFSYSGGFTAVGSLDSLFYAWSDTIPVMIVMSILYGLVGICSGWCIVLIFRIKRKKRDRGGCYRKSN